MMLKLVPAGVPQLIKLCLLVESLPHSFVYNALHEISDDGSGYAHHALIVIMSIAVVLIASMLPKTICTKWHVSCAAS